MSPITFTQQGIITQCELAKILVITSDGLVPKDRRVDPRLSAKAPGHFVRVTREAAGPVTPVRIWALRPASVRTPLGWGAMAA